MSFKKENIYMTQINYKPILLHYITLYEMQKCAIYKFTYLSNSNFRREKLNGTNGQSFFLLISKNMSLTRTTYHILVHPHAHIYASLFIYNIGIIYFMMMER